MKNSLMLAIGHNQNVLMFNAIGIDGIIVTDDNFNKVLEKYIADGIKIFFISQKFIELLRKTKEKINENAYPIFLTINMELKEKNLGLDEIRKNVESATGINLI